MQGRLLKQTFSLSSSSSDGPRKIQEQECHELLCLQALTVSLPTHERTGKYKWENTEYFGQEIFTGVELEPGLSASHCFAQLGYHTGFSFYFLCKVEQLQHGRFP